MDTEENKNLPDLISELLRTSEQEIKSYITEVVSNVSLKDTKAISHCYFLTMDGNGRPQVKDFARFVAKHVADYAIPRKEFAEAQKYDLEHIKELTKNGNSISLVRLEKAGIQSINFENLARSIEEIQLN